MSNKEKPLQTSCGYLLKKTQHALRLHMDNHLRTIDLTTPQYAVLSQLEQHPGISNADLARAAFITPQTMYTIICNLENRNLIKRIPAKNHGRILQTQLTKQGLEMVLQAHQLITQAELTMFKAITKSEQKLFEQLLSRCFENLNKPI